MVENTEVTKCYIDNSDLNCRKRRETFLDLDDAVGREEGVIEERQRARRKDMENQNTSKRPS